MLGRLLDRLDRYGVGPACLAAQILLTVLLWRA